MRGHVERRTQAIAETLVIGPQRQWVTVLRGCSGIDQIERTVLSVVVEFLQNPGLDLRAAVRERDAVETVFDDGFSLTGSLLSYSIDGNGRNSGRCGSRRGCSLGLRGLILRGLILRLRRRGLRAVFFEQRLKSQDDHESKHEYEKQAALGTRFLLRILKVGQVIGFLGPRRDTKRTNFLSLYALSLYAPNESLLPDHNHRRPMDDSAG